MTFVVLWATIVTSKFKSSSRYHFPSNFMSSHLPSPQPLQEQPQQGTSNPQNTNEKETEEQPTLPSSTVSSTNKIRHAHFTIVITFLLRVLFMTLRLNSSLPQRHLNNLLPFSNLHLFTIRTQHLLFIHLRLVHLNIPSSFCPLRLHYFHLSHYHHNRRQNHQHGHVAVELCSQEGNRAHLTQHLG